MRFQLTLPVVAGLLATVAVPTGADDGAGPADSGSDVISVPRGRGQAWLVPVNIDPRDGAERFAVLLPGGPLIVEATLTIDGEPFRTQRETLIDEMLTAADTDGDGSVGWEEALLSPAFTFGRGLRERERAQLVEMLDHDGNGTVDRAEARAFLAAEFQGPAFQVTSGADVPNDGLPRSAGGGTSDVRAFLDVDGDGVLSKIEIDSAAERLLSRDVDENGILYPTEIGSVATNYLSRRQLYAARLHAVLLGQTISAENLFVTLRDKYETEGGVIDPGCFRAFPDLFDQLDVDRDRILSAGELIRLNQIPPHVRIAVDLASSGEALGLAVTYVDGGRVQPGDTAGNATVNLSGAAVTFTAGVAPRIQDDTASALFLLGQYDTDGNEYLDESEIAASPESQQQRFAAWDTDGDGSIIIREMTDGMARERVPQRTRVETRVSRSGDPLLAALDLSGDSRLGLREMRTAAVQLRSFDTNHDGRIEEYEVPVPYVVQFLIGDDPPDPMGPTRVYGPAWFVRMDRNGDGDVTFNEFPGDRDAFETLDTSGDGFIEPAEARAASEEEGEEG